MSADPRAALATFVSALERHLEAASSRRGENDPAVTAAYQDLAEAFDQYDDALMDAFGEVTPLEIYAGDDSDEYDEDDDDDDDLEDDEDEDLDDDAPDEDEDEDLDEVDDFDGDEDLDVAAGPDPRR